MSGPAELDQEHTLQPARIDVGLQDGPVEAITLEWPADCGGEAVFLGRTRMEAHPEHGPLRWLEYECYAEMAEPVLGAMAREAVERFGCRAVRIVHGVGKVMPGEASIVIQCATPHRGEAFDACRYLIDRIKHELPVWKREIWERGETFVEGCCASHD